MKKIRLLHIALQPLRFNDYGTINDVYIVPHAIAMLQKIWVVKIIEEHMIVVRVQFLSRDSWTGFVDGVVAEFSGL